MVKTGDLLGVWGTGGYKKAAWGSGI